MALMSYKCPNCGGGLVFDPDSQKFQCEYCLSEFTEEEMKRMEEVSASPAEEEEGTAPQERRLPSAITAITRWSFPAAFRETICRTLSSPLPLIKRRPHPAF